MKTFITVAATALSLAIAAPAVAGVSAGEAQFAKSLGLEPGAYSFSTMLKIEDAKRENDTALLNLLLTRTVGNEFVTRGVADEQLAAASKAEGLSVSDIIFLERAEHENEEPNIEFISQGRPGNDTTSDRGVVTGGKAQLAASIGVNPADYTTNELVALAAVKFNADNARN